MSLENCRKCGSIWHADTAHVHNHGRVGVLVGCPNCEPMFRFEVRSDKLGALVREKLDQVRDIIEAQGKPLPVGFRALEKSLK